MKFAVISDLHIDITAWEWTKLDLLPADVNTVVVAGDISNDVLQACEWLYELRQRFVNVIWVPGNHDFYNLGFHRTRLRYEGWTHPQTVREILDHYAEWSKKHGIHLLDRSSVTLDGITFVGATGWHDFVAGEPILPDVQIEAWYHKLNDTRICWDRNGIPDHRHPLRAAAKDADFLRAAMIGLTGPTVVVTHHIPHRSCLTQRPHDLVWQSLHGSFANTMLENIGSPFVKYWIYGHTHTRSMKNLNGVDYVNNARGYPGECPNWEPVILDI